MAVFPAAVFLLVAARVLSANYNANNPTEGVFVPPLIGNPNIAGNMGSILAFGLILLGPELLNMMRDALKTQGSKAAGAAIGGGIGAGVGAAIGIPKNVAGTRMSADEVIQKKMADGSYNWGQRGLGKAIFGRWAGK